MEGREQRLKQAKEKLKDIEFEWDRILLEMEKLNKHLNELRKEMENACDDIERIRYEDA